MGYDSGLLERWMSGLSRTPGKRVWVNSPPRVRIPPSPPSTIGPTGPVLLSAPPITGNSPAAIHPRENAIRRLTLAQRTSFSNTATCALPFARLEPEMPRLLKGWMSLCLALGLVAGGLPAQASEVVKLARLVVSGKRAPIEATRTTPPESRPAPSSQTTHGSGGSDDAGTAPTPARGVS